MAKILIVEDEKSINQLMQKTLFLAGHQCVQVYTGLDAIAVLEHETVDIVLLDINLPDLDGFRVAEQIDFAPIIFVTARDEINDRVKGLLGGAEDYITKPFAMEELVARVYVVLRRYHKAERTFILGDVSVNFQSCEVFDQNRPVKLTSQEFSLLEILIINKNITLSRTRLLDLAWGMDFDGDERTVDVHIQRLRKKLHLEEKIKTVYKFGYRLEI